MTALDRLIANGNALIGAYKQFGSGTEGTVSFVWLNDDDTEEIISFDNIKKFQSSISSQLSTALENINNLANAVNIRYIDGELKLVDGSSLNYMTQEDMNSAITQQVENLNTTAIRLAAIGAVNLKYVQDTGKLFDAEDNEIAIVTGTQLTEAINNITMPTVPTNEEIENLALEKTNIQYNTTGGLLDKDDNPIVIAVDSGVSFVDFLLKDETDTSISQILFNLSDTTINHNDVESLEIIGTNVNSSSACRIYLYAYNQAGAVIPGYMGVSYHGNNEGNMQQSATHNSNNNYIWFPVAQDINPQSNGYYGHGVNFKCKIPVKAVTDASTSYKNTGTLNYEVFGWLYSSTYPDSEIGQWSNYSSNRGYGDDIYGFKLYPNSGTFQRGIIKVRVNLKSKKVGA